MGLKTIGSTGTTNYGTGIQWYSSDTDAGRTKINTGALIRASSTQTYGSGYTETNTLVSKSTAYNAAYQAKSYSTLPANSDKCTGWFLPSAGQYYAIMSQLGGGISPDTWNISDWLGNMVTVTSKINTALSKVGANKYTEFFQGVNAYEWTSSEHTATSAVDLDGGIDDKMGWGSVRFFGNSNSTQKTREHYVRPFLAF